MVVDYEAAWVSLKAEIVRKRSHGARDLAYLMAELEVANRVPEQQEGFDPTPPRRTDHKDRPTTERPLHVAGARNG